MAKKANYQKAIEKLKEKGITDDVINNALNGCADNKAKFEALKPLCEENAIVFDKKGEKNNNENNKDKSPTLEQYFGKSISDLLIKRKALINSITIKDIDNLLTKPINELTAEEIADVQRKWENDKNKKLLKNIDTKLENKGIIIKPVKKKKNITNSMPETNQN